jgi:hypothetical protein
MSGRTLLIAMATAGALASLPAPAARAAFYSGNDLWAQCSGDNIVQAALCLGFVAGIADAMSVAASKACFPSGVNAGQAVDVVKLFLGQHPERRHEAAVFLVAQALSETFPCKP